MIKLEETDKWPKILQRADEGKSLREIAEEVKAQPGAINNALKRMGIEKAPAPPGPRARRGASPPPVKAPKAPKVAKEIKTRQKAAKAAKPKTFPEVLSGVFEEFGYPNHDMTTPEKAGDAIRSMFVSLGLTRLDNLSDDDTDDCDENAESVQAPSVPVDADSSGEDDGGDCDGFDADHVRFAFGFNGESTVSGDFDGLNVVGLPVVTLDADSQPSVVGEVIAQTVNEYGGLTVQIAVDPNEVTLRGEEVFNSPDDWGTPPSFSIPSDEELASMSREALQSLCANPAVKDALMRAGIKGTPRFKTAEVIRADLIRVRNDS